MRAEKTIMRQVPGAVMAAMLAACSNASPDQPVQPSATPITEASDPAAAATAAATAAAAPLPVAKPVSIDDSTPLYEFSYAYPVQAAAIPALAGWFKADAAKMKHELVVHAKEGQSEAKADGRAYYPYGHSTKWDVVTDLPGWLSLSAQRWESLGGAHPNPWQEGLVWNKAGGKRMKAADLFASHAALSVAIRTPFCAALDKQRAEKRGGAVNRKSGDQFDECIDPAAQTVILGSNDKAHFTRIGILVDPYSAGPYTEGNYTVTLPVTAAVLHAVKPQYRSAFAVPH